MKYEFHVGDYVETKDGKVGYIAQVVFSNEVERWCSMRIMCRQNDFIISFEGYENSISDRFNRIGQYDFTKEDEGKIEKLETRSYLDARAIVLKINELVKVVNQLEEKVNEMV